MKTVDNQSALSPRGSPAPLNEALSPRGSPPPLGGALSPRGSPPPPWAEHSVPRAQENKNKLTLLLTLFYLPCLFVVFCWIVCLLSYFYDFFFVTLLVCFVIMFPLFFFSLFLVYAEEFSAGQGFVLCSKPNFLY